MFAVTRTVALLGAVGHLVDVQVDVGPGTVHTALVGRPDAAITEGRDRCRSAVENSGYVWPSTRRVTILLSPADLPKRGPHFDLAIALGVIAASGESLAPESLERTIVIGELSLDGRVRCVPGVLPMVLSAARQGIGRAIVPEPQLPEAALVPGIEIIGIRSLQQAIAVLQGDPEIPWAPPVEPLVIENVIGSARGPEHHEPDLADLIGLDDARFALEVVAAGGHHLMLIGPKGAGKTSLAERLPSILPDLDPAASLEATAVHALAGVLPGGRPIVRPPFRAPHHTASRSGILGGGTGRVRPGELSKAHHGVLFLDEFPLLPQDVMEGLRQPLESGAVTIVRGEEEATFPARSMVVLAANPCPCGNFSPAARDSTCECTEVKRREYRRKLSGAIADRIDVLRVVAPPARHEVEDPLATRESSAVVGERVRQARGRQATRFRETSWRTNAEVPGPRLRRDWPMTPEAETRLDLIMYGGALTRRGVTRVHRVAWTVADLRGLERPGLPELLTALRLRSGDPLEVAELNR